MNMRSMVKHGYIQTGGSSITADNVSQNNEFKVYKGEFKIGDEILNLKRDNLAIKIDVEGHELNVLKGIQNLLKSNKTICSFASFVSSGARPNFFAIISRMKYSFSSTTFS